MVEVTREVFVVRECQVRQITVYIVVRIFHRSFIVKLKEKQFTNLEVRFLVSLYNLCCVYLFTHHRTLLFVY